MISTTINLVQWYGPALSRLLIWGGKSSKESYFLVNPRLDELFSNMRISHLPAKNLRWLSSLVRFNSWDMPSSQCCKAPCLNHSQNLVASCLSEPCKTWDVDLWFQAPSFASKLKWEEYWTKDRYDRYWYYWFSKLGTNIYPSTHSQLAMSFLAWASQTTHKFFEKDKDGNSQSIFLLTFTSISIVLLNFAFDWD